MGVVPGDKIRYHLGAGDRIDEATLLPGRQGTSDDRYSNASSWEVAYTPDDLAKRLDDYLGSGRLLDIVPVRRGVSGRVTEIKVSGSKGSAVIKGFSIRTALGLKENLFTVDRQRDRSGALRRIVFNGRGWGHGVGMCQVGAYGMALRGLSYRDILTHYYSGITLERLP
jgi:stage II sporulation protein D